MSSLIIENLHKEVNVYTLITLIAFQLSLAELYVYRDDMNLCNAVINVLATLIDLNFFVLLKFKLMSEQKNMEVPEIEFGMMLIAGLFITRLALGSIYVLFMICLRSYVSPLIIYHVFMTYSLLFN